MLNNHKILGLMALLCLMPLAINAQKLPAKIDKKTKIYQHQYFAVEVQNYAQFVQDMQLFQNNVKILFYDETQQLVTILTDSDTYKKHIQTNANVCVAKMLTTRLRAEGTQTDHNFNVNKINRLQNEYPDLTGEGMLVGLHESFLDTTDIDLRGRVVLTGNESATLVSHTTDMATVLIGAGNSSTRGRGVAWKANLTLSNNVDTLPASDSYYQSQNLGVQNHSYGIAINNYYSKHARAYDLSANNNPNLLHVVSAGNDGEKVDSFGTYKFIKYFGNISGHFKMAKNMLNVGAVGFDKAVYSYSSRGPAYDGRIKPDVVAFGGVKGGTSNATAVTSGIVTLLQQAYKQKNSNQLPSATLLKAVLINSAEDVENKGPDYKSGYGNVNAYRAHQGLMQNQYFSGTATQGNTNSFSLDVPANAVNLKITVVWNDPATTENAAKALVNDLDLTVSQGGNTWNPWILNTTADATALNQDATTGEDHLNNVEQVTVDAPTAGTYTIQIKGTNITTTNQSFYIAYQWDIKDQFSWNFPTADDNLPYHGEQYNYFRWESTFAAGQTGKLEYSLDKGQSWQVIKPDVDLSKGFYEWTEVDETFSLAMARMTVNTQEIVTDTFTLSRPLSISVGFNCSDSVMIHWPKKSNIAYYTVHTYGDKYLKQIAQTTDTIFVFSKTQYPNTEYTVIPHFADSKKSGIMAALHDYRNGGVDCYLVSFFAQAKVDTGLVLNLTLGTVRGVKNIQYERLNGSVFEAIGNQTPETSSVLTYTDSTPFPRQNAYRARILFNNGQEVVTDTAKGYYLDQEKFIVFPNPAAREKPLNIYSKDFQDDKIHFQLFNSRGQLVYSEYYTADRFSINLTRYPSGLYYYRINTSTTQKTGKIILK